MTRPALGPRGRRHLQGVVTFLWRLTMALVLLTLAAGAWYADLGLVGMALAVAVVATICAGLVDELLALTDDEQLDLDQ